MNYMEQVAKLVDVEMNELFDLFSEDGELCYTGVKITNKGVVDSNGYRKYILLETILIGHLLVKKRPWKQKNGGSGYVVYCDGTIERNFFQSHVAFDCALIAMGNCFRTREEAELHKEEMLAKMKEVLSE